VGLSAPCGRILSILASALFHVNACHRASRCPRSPIRAQEKSSYLEKYKAYDWLSHMAIAFAIAKPTAIPSKYGDSHGTIPPEMAQWVTDRHSPTFDLAIWRTDRRALGPFGDLRRQQAAAGSELPHRHRRDLWPLPPPKAAGATSPAAAGCVAAARPHATCLPPPPLRRCRPSPPDVPAAAPGASHCHRPPQAPGHRPPPAAWLPLGTTASGCVAAALLRPTCLPHPALRASSIVHDQNLATDRCRLRRCRPAPPLQVASLPAVVAAAGYVAAPRHQKCCLSSLIVCAASPLRSSCC